MQRLIRPQLKSVGLALVMLASLVGFWHIVSGSAQQQDSAAQGKWKVKNTGPKDPRAEANPMTAQEASEYTIENQIPAHLPLKVELLNLDQEPLLANIGVKVTNTANKPIYFLDLTLYLPDLKSKGGVALGFPLSYGREELVDFKTPIAPEDVPIKPGESFVFKIHEKLFASFERNLAQMNKSQAEIRRVYLFFSQLNFGDGTGFLSNAGTPIPNNVSNELSKCRDGTKSNLQSSKSPEDICCPGTPCSKLVPGRFSCQCPDPINPNMGYSGRTTFTTSCSDPLGTCGTSLPFILVWCDLGGDIFGCQEFRILACGAPTPTPQPTSTPTPDEDPFPTPSPCTDIDHDGDG